VRYAGLIVATTSKLGVSFEGILRVALIAPVFFGASL
jgi:hypothetical protein